MHVRFGLSVSLQVLIHANLELQFFIILYVNHSFEELL